MKRIPVLLSMLLVATIAIAVPQKKIIDNGGSGKYSAEAVSDATLPGFVIYKPQDVAAAVKQVGALPLLVFANGACNDTSLPHEKMLNDLASYGYLVIALGELQERIDDRKLNKSPNEDMIRAVEWAERQNKTKESIYYNSIDVEHIAFGGQSCGGAQVLANCADKRVKSCILFNSGMGNMEMSGASKESLKKLHCPILYIIGGESDIAYNNAIIDYENIHHVPVAFANQLFVGHGGTFHETYGGSFSRLLRNWLDWQFKNQSTGKEVFLCNHLADYPDYTMKAKNFPQNNDPYTTREIHCKSRDGKDIWGIAYIPNTKEAKKPTVVMAHGYNSSYKEPESYAQCLAMRGVASYLFDFCGGSNRSKSEGKTPEMTLFTEMENIEEVTRTVKSWDFVDSSRVTLLGCSQGGIVAALTAAYNPTMFKSLVLVYPAFSIPETGSMMLEQFGENDTLDVEGMVLGRDFYETIKDMPVLDIIGKYKGKTYMVYGDKDEVIAGNTLELSKTKYEQLEVKIISGAYHGFADYMSHQQATEGIVKFVLGSLHVPVTDCNE